MIALPMCPFRHFKALPFCSHPQNAESTMSLHDCRQCTLHGSSSTNDTNETGSRRTPANATTDEPFPCIYRGRVLGQTGCQCGSGVKSIDVYECLAGHGLDIALTDGVNANACQLANHQKPHVGTWRLPLLPSCSTCEFCVRRDA